MKSDPFPPPLLTPAQAGMALSVIPANCSEADRRCVAVGLYAAFGEAGYVMWCTWAGQRALPNHAADEDLWSTVRGHYAKLIAPFIQLASEAGPPDQVAWAIARDLIHSARGASS